MSLLSKGVLNYCLTLIYPKLHIKYFKRYGNKDYLIHQL